MDETNPVLFALKNKAVHEAIDSSGNGGVSVFGWLFFGLLVLIIILGYMSLYRAGKKKRGNT